MYICELLVCWLQISEKKKKCLHPTIIFHFAAVLRLFLARFTGISHSTRLARYIFLILFFLFALFLESDSIKMKCKEREKEKEREGEAEGKRERERGRQGEGERERFEGI